MKSMLNGLAMFALATAAAVAHAETGRDPHDDRHRRVGGLFGAGAGARQRDARRGAGLLPGGQRGGRHQRPQDRTAFARRRLRARPRRGQYQEADRRRRVPAVRLRRHADVQRGEADFHRREGAVRRARSPAPSRCAIPSIATSSTSAPAISTKPRRSSSSWSGRRSTASPCSTRTTTTARPACAASSARCRSAT